MKNKKELLSKIILLVEIIMIISFFAGIYIYRAYKKNDYEKKLYEQRLEMAYECANASFAIGRKPGFHDFSYVHQDILCLCIGAYRDQNPDASITIEDIRDFLSKEFDDNGNPRVLNPPENIVAYIDWYNWGGGTYSDRYTGYLIHYLRDNQDEYKGVNLGNADLDTLNKIIDEFNSCPDRSKYEYY